MGIFNNDKPKQVVVPRDYDPYAEPVTPDYNLEGQPRLSEIDDSDTQKQSIVSNEHFQWLQTLYDQEPPRKSEYVTQQLLARIADLLSQSRQVSTPSDFMSPRSYRVPADTELEITVDGLTPYGYIYVPPHAVNISLSYGYGRGQTIGTVPAQRSGWAIIPHIDVITIIAPSNPTAYTVNVYPSTRPFKFELTSDVTTGGASPGTVSADTEMPPAALNSASLSNVAAPQVNSLIMGLSGGSVFPVAITANNADNIGGTGLLVSSFQHVLDGAVWDRLRTPSVFTTFDLASATAETTIWDPALARRFVWMGGWITASAQTVLTFRDNTAGTIIAIAEVAANVPFMLSDMGNGIRSATVNNVLTVTRSIAATLRGTLLGTEEI